MIQFFRNKFLDLSRDAKREFIGNRITNKNTNTGSSTTEFFLENIETMNYYVAQGMIPLKPSCAPQHMVKVCHAFFVWVLQISRNKVYQPTVDSTEFSNTMNSGRHIHFDDYGASESVKKWLINFAQAHLHDPTKHQRIILSVPSRKVVYELYEKDFIKGNLFYFPQRKGEYFLPSHSYFMRCWRYQSYVKKIFEICVV